MESFQSRALDEHEHEMAQQLALEGAAMFDTVYENDEFYVVVGVTPAGMTHLAITRSDDEMVRDWKTLQHIKDEILGVDVEAVELFPARDRVQDRANVTHLWALPAGQRFSFGMTAD